MHYDFQVIPFLVLIGCMIILPVLLLIDYFT